MKIRGFLATAAAAMVCCVTLGCPPAENNEDVPVEVEVGDPAATDVDSATTAAPAPATPPADDVTEVEE